MKQLVLIALIIPFLAGCDNLTGEYSLYALITGKSKAKKSKESEVPKKPVLPEIDDTTLAKLLLKPEKYELDVQRDPFMPIVEENKDKKKGPNPMSMIAKPDPMALVRQLTFQGVVNIGGEFSALIKNRDEKGVYSVNEVVNSLKIKKITEEELTVEKDNQTFVIKRGEQ